MRRRSSPNDPASKADVEAIIETIISNANFDWTDDSGDGIQEPLLYVSDSMFAPAKSGSEPLRRPLNRYYWSQHLRAPGKVYCTRHGPSRDQYE